MSKKAAKLDKWMTQTPAESAGGAAYNGFTDDTMAELALLVNDSPVDDIVDLSSQGNDAGRIQELEAENAQLAHRLQQFKSAMEEGQYLYLEGCRLSRTGLDIPEGLDSKQWEYVGRTLRGIDIALQWMIGDWFVFGSEHYGHKYEGFAEDIGFAIRTLQQYKYVAENVDFSVRTEKLSFTHHQLVASLRDNNGIPNKVEQRLWLNRAEENHWSVKQMRAEMSGKIDAKPVRYFKAVHSLKSRFRAWMPEMPSQDKKKLAQELRQIADELEKD